MFGTNIEEKTADFTSGENLYPLQKKFTLAGLVFGIVSGAVSFNLLVGLSTFVLFFGVGWLWRRREPPILVACFISHWIWATIGYFYKIGKGEYPAFPFATNIEKAVLLSLAGLICVVMGIRFTLHLLKPRLVFNWRKIEALNIRYSVQRLFWIVIFFFSINWFMEIFPMGMIYNAAQLIMNLFLFRELFFFMLLLAILNQREGFKYGVIVFLYVLLPKFISYFSGFKEIFLLLIIAFLSRGQRDETSEKEKKFDRKVMVVSVIFIIIVYFFGLAWEGAIKPVWRPAIKSGMVKGTPVDKLREFSSVVVQTVPKLDLAKSTDSLAIRLASPLGYFSYVLLRVPNMIPHENGALTLRAWNHMIRPRILFPEKEGLGSHSWLIRKYAGFNVAGLERETTIALGYIPQLYIDYGSYGMLLAVFLLGMLLGFVYALILMFSQSYYIFSSAVTVVFMRNYLYYETELAFLLGSLFTTTIVFMGLIILTGAWFDKRLTVRQT
ncbi:MAG: hypothetical protein C4533_06560 [Candidatus Omnitrophota bacterium]|jgi:hypothetical protein|nr:MAG: hypothetical protein C4533_06560 [Candidatus Omnitrophota bacterium]